ncbi:MAG: hypothetical protein IT430_19950 [Phycisphaerales bacterium]|nr:hypothetical protein [Phycisphaerales bacterium]
MSRHTTFLVLLWLVACIVGCEKKKQPPAPPAPVIKQTPAPQPPELDQEARELLEWAALVQQIASDPSPSAPPK